MGKSFSRTYLFDLLGTWIAQLQQGFERLDGVFSLAEAGVNIEELMNNIDVRLM